MDKSEILSLPQPLVFALGMLVLCGIVVLCVQLYNAIKNQGMPGRVRAWNGTTEGFCLLIAVVVLLFLCMPIVFGGIIGAIGIGNEYLSFVVALTGQVLSLAGIFLFLPKANPDFRFQIGECCDTSRLFTENAGRQDENYALPERRDENAENGPSVFRIVLKKIFGTWGLVSSFAGALVLIYTAMFAVKGVEKILKRLTGKTFGLDEPQQIVGILARHREDWLFLCLAALTAVVLAPVLEELFFRGLVYPFFKKRMGTMVSICATGVIFGVIHFSTAAFLPLSVFGAYLCVLYEKTGDIRVPITVHALFNLNTFLFIFLQGVPKDLI